MSDDWNMRTKLVHGGTRRSQYGEVSEAIFLTQGFVYDSAEAAEARFTELYREKFANPYVAAGRGFIDDVIEPGETRARLIDDLDMLLSKREDKPSKKHGNIPI